MQSLNFQSFCYPIHFSLLIFAIMIELPKYTLDIFAFSETEDEAISFFQERGLLLKQKLCSEGHEMNIYDGEKCRCYCKKEYMERYGLSNGTLLKILASIL